MVNHNEFFNNIDPGFDFYKEKENLEKNLNWLKSLSVEEFTFYKKYEELQTYKNLGDSPEISKSKIWVPTDINNEKLTISEIESIDPVVIYVENGSMYDNTWLMLRLFCHTMEFSQSPGRFLRFLAIDRTSNKFLGVMSVASDVIIIVDRDKYIGWTPDNKLKDKKLTNSAIGSCIMSTQPFGYNFLGGKLIACLITSDVIRNKWKELYNQALVGMTTTSLYGSYSMYNNLKWWHKCGTSSGKILIKPDIKMYEIWHDWIKDNKKYEYEKMMTQKEGVSGPVTAAKLKVLTLIMRSCGLQQKQYVHGFERGTYYSCFYENTKEFLCNKIKENKLVMKSLFKDNTKSIMEWWKPKAIERYKKLKQENRLKPEILFYDKLVGMSYEEAKYKFLSEVGR